MAQAPDRTSTLPALMVNLTATQPAGALVRIATAQGQEALTFEPTRQYQSVVFSAPVLTLGASYTVSVGGAPVATLTLSDVVTLHGSGGMRGGPGGTPGGRR